MGEGVRNDQVSDLLIRALAPLIRQGNGPRPGVEFTRLSSLAAVVPDGCSIRVDFKVADTLGAPLVILERPVIAAGPSGSDTLTPRERRIASLVATGATNKQIARTLRLTVGTVKAYVHVILRKLGASNRASVAAAYRTSTEVTRTAPRGS